MFKNLGKSSFKSLSVIIGMLTLIISLVGCSAEDTKVEDKAKDLFAKVEEQIDEYADEKSVETDEAVESDEVEIDGIALEESDAVVKDDGNKEESLEDGYVYFEAEKEDALKIKATSTSIPKYSGKAYAKLNKNKPSFKAAELKKKSYESYGKLDKLGRCTVTKACIGKDLMPKGKRGAIGSVKPTGWHTVKYDIVDGKYLYNRCHLIGWQLTGENANKQNLITGTRYMNVEGMLPFEDMVADYIRETGNHVMYRVTPVYKGNNLLATGVKMEAKSVEDKGKGICFNIFVYNVQPGITIDYATGASRLSSQKATKKPVATKKATATKKPTSNANASTKKQTFVLNTNSKKYHKSTCKSIKSIKNTNKKNYTGTEKDLKSKGYSACKNCFK